MEEYVKHLDNVVKIIKRLLHTKNVDYKILGHQFIGGHCEYHVLFDIDCIKIRFDIFLYEDIIKNEKELARYLLREYVEENLKICWRNYRMKTFEKYIKEISKILANSHCDNAYLCNICNVRNVCEKLGSLDEKEIHKFLLSEYKEPIKLTQFEYDMLSTTSKYHLWLGELKNGLYYIKMKEKGYFKNVDLSMTAKEVLENCEVVENVD